MIRSGNRADTSTVFVPFAVFYLREPLKLDYLWAALCLLGAVYFVFRGQLAGRDRPERPAGSGRILAGGHT